MLAFKSQSDKETSGPMAAQRVLAAVGSSDFWKNAARLVFLFDCVSHNIILIVFLYTVSGMF